jgi:hypothetical protein
MPCSEIADSIVSIGKETLQNAMSYINATEKWKAKVIYGDTDSIFILLEGRTKEEAIAIGKEIAAEITKMNPEPMKLQFEKIYCPMIFMSKKHYAGYKYEDIGQVSRNEKVFEAKGIETVRRDTCEAVSKMCEKVLKILFENKDLSLVKEYLYHNLTKLITGKVAIKDLIFAKEVKLGKYRGKNLPASALVAWRKYQRDNANLPRYKEREPYLVYHNQQNSKALKDSVISPEEYIDNKDLFIHVGYYVEKHMLPTLSRIFEPFEVDVLKWYAKYNRPQSNKSNLYFLEKPELIDGNKSIDFKFDSRETNDSKRQQFLAPSKNKTIHNFYDKTSKNFNNDSKNSKQIQIFKNVRRYETEDEDEDPRLNYLENSIGTNKNLSRLDELEKICRACSEFDKFNIDIEKVPCTMLYCKIFYEKLYIVNNSD